MVKECKTNFDLDKGYFSTAAINALQKIDILTLKDLILVSESDLNNKLLQNRDKIPFLVQTEILGTRRLLRYKYLKEDPEIPLYDPRKVNLFFHFGLSSNTAETLYYRCGCDAPKIIEIILNNDYESLEKLLGVGAYALEEVKLKTSIFHEYYLEKLNEEELKKTLIK